MKTTITNNSQDRRAFLCDGGARNVNIGQSVTVFGLVLSAERRAELEGEGWSFEGEGAAATDQESLQVAEVKPAPKRGRKAKSAI